MPVPCQCESVVCIVQHVTLSTPLGFRVGSRPDRDWRACPHTAVVEVKTHWGTYQMCKPCADSVPRKYRAD